MVKMDAMKKVMYFAFAATLAGCTAKIGENGTNPYEPKLIRTVEAYVNTDENSEVRTSLEGLTMKWSDGDAIVVSADPSVSQKPYSVTIQKFDLSEGAGTNRGVFTSETGIAGAEFYAGYPASSCTVKEGERYFYYSFPHEQVYVANGIKDGYVPMFAYKTTDPSALKFKYGSGIIRLNLYDAVSETPVAITKIEVITDVPASGDIVASLNLDRFPAYRLNTNKQTTITYTVPAVQLSSNPDQPTQFNICLANTYSNGANLTTDGNYASVKFVIHAADGSTFTQEKTNQRIEGGKIYNMPALQYKRDLASYKVGDYYPDPNVDLKNAEEVAKIKGIVFSISDGGYHGKIVSLKEGSGLQWSLSGTVDHTDDPDDGAVNAATIKTLEDQDATSIQYPAFEWAESLGEGWYIPALNELKEIRTLYGDLNADKTAINAKFTAVGGTALSDIYYYSSTEYDILTTEGASQRNRCYALNFKRTTTASDLIFGAIKKSSNSTNCVFRAVKKF